MLYLDINLLAETTPTSVFDSFAYPGEGDGKNKAIRNTYYLIEIVNWSTQSYYIFSRFGSKYLGGFPRE